MVSISTIIIFCSSFVIGFCCSFLIMFNTNSGVDLLFNKIKTNCLRVTYKLFYVYSVFQIKCNKINNYLSPYFASFQNRLQMLFKKDNINDETNAEPFSKINIRIEVYDNSTLKPLFESNLTKMNEENFTCLETFSDYTMIITDLSEDNNHALTNNNTNNTNNTKKIKNIKIIRDTYLENLDLNFELSNITFVALYLNYNNERYNINLKINDFNFYVVGNIINKTFLQYYIKNILHNNICIKTDTEDLRLSYKLELMDHEVNLLSLTETQYIIIEKNGYNVGDTNYYLEDKKVVHNITEDTIINNEIDKVVDKLVDTVLDKSVETYDLMDDNLE
jgi:hypothetical protein